MSEECRYIDLRMRMPNDGSLLFQVLSSLSTTVARNARATQLMVLGVMLESGRLSGLPVGAPMNSTVLESAGSHSAITDRITSVEPLTERFSRTAPDAADVMTVFG